MLETPVLFLVFKRPAHTLRVFSAIQKARPKKLFVAADGPRDSAKGEEELCAEVRKIIEEGISWPCEVETLFREKNLGCKKAVSSAIDWFFDKNEAGIILEDDTLPNGSFFHFCEHLLKKHAQDERVMHISGDNFQDGRLRGEGAYYFSRFAHSWGWATWRRAWAHYDVAMEGFREEWASVQKLHAQLPEWARFWEPVFLRLLNGEIDTWDYQWHYAICKRAGLCAIPNLNMVSNIGTGKDATHTAQKSFMTSVRSREFFLRTPPASLAYDDGADLFDFSNAAAGVWPPRKNFAEQARFFRFLLGNYFATRSF